MQERLQQAIGDLKNAPKINIHGKPYTSVATRVEVFRRYFPEYSLTTDIVYDDEQRIVIKATVANADTVIATGYAEELRGVGKINSTSALENTETSSIGRALAAMGIHGGEYASHNEVHQAIEQQQYTQPVVQNTSPQPRQSTATVQNFSALTQLGLQVQEFNGELVVSGKTYGKQELLKQNGFAWDASRKLWHQRLQQAA